MDFFLQVILGAASFSLKDSRGFVASSQGSEQLGNGMARRDEFFSTRPAATL